MHEPEQVLVIAPHPDDETLGCGGTLIQLAQSGVQADYVFVTSGECGTHPGEYQPPANSAALALRRQGEAREAVQRLTGREVIFLNGRDGAVSEQQNLIIELDQVLRQRTYQRVFVCWPYDQHPDHQATFIWFRQALEFHPEIKSIWLYEVWSPLQPSIVIPIDATFAAKRHALAAHQSQLDVLNYDHAFTGLAMYRAIWSPPSQYAEAFQVLTREQLLRMK
jgi:N-acetylglucosamine malate deacetylase 1